MNRSCDTSPKYVLNALIVDIKAAWVHFLITADLSAFHLPLARLCHILFFNFMCGDIPAVPPQLN